MRSSFHGLRPDFAPTTPELRDAFEREYIVCLAGKLAQERFTGRRAEGFAYEEDAKSSARHDTEVGPVGVAADEERQPIDAILYAAA
jgi:hypothetical protein